MTPLLNQFYSYKIYLQERREGPWHWHKVLGASCSWPQLVEKHPSPTAPDRGTETDKHCSRQQGLQKRVLHCWQTRNLTHMPLKQPMVNPDRQRPQDWNIYSGSVGFHWQKAGCDILVLTTTMIFKKWNIAIMLIIMIICIKSSTS